MTLKKKLIKAEMTFDEKFTECMRNFEAQSSPSYTRNELHLFSDFVELVALFSKNGMVSYGDIQDRFFGTKDYSTSEERDEDEGLLIDIFMLLQERSLLYGSKYPFIFDNSSTLLKVQSSFSEDHKLYVYLLISSKLNIFKPFRSELASEFEYICKDALVKYLPSRAVVKKFGAGSEYSGTAITKITNLANDLNLSVDDYELSQVSDRNNQERGLDIVGWIPFDDKCMNLLIFLAQCACGKNFESKQHDTRRFKNYIHFYKSHPIHIMFIPYSLINPNMKKFYHSDLIEKDYLVFERKRIVELYDGQNFNTLQSYNVVNSCLRYKENLV